MPTYQDTLYSFFTPLWLCEVMFTLAKRHGHDPKTDKVLEPSCGNGNFLSLLEYPEHCTAFEISKAHSEKAKERVPDATIYNQYFETAFLEPTNYRKPLQGTLTWLKDYPFDLVIGNPPYGRHQNLYSSHFKKLKARQTELFFMIQGMRLLKKGGLLVFITASSFMRNDNTYTPVKQELSRYTTFVDAYRMPKVFEKTNVPVDILIFKKK